MTNKQKRVDRLQSVLPSLIDGQLDWLEQVAMQFGKPHAFERWPGSDLINDGVLARHLSGLRYHNHVAPNRADW